MRPLSLDERSPIIHSADAAPLVAASGVGKSFGGQRVLEGVDFDVLPGEVHVLAGENGAGKSTLMRILCGVLPPDEGQVAIGGEHVELRSAQDAGRRGVAMIHQELSLAPSLSVADNLFLAREPLARLGWIDRRAEREAARDVLRRVGLAVDPETLVGSLPMGSRQLVEVAKALLRDARVLIMDEPTSALSKPEAERLFVLVRELIADRARPTGVVYITHRMEEIDALANRITVLRDGRRVVTAPRDALPPAALVQAMVGREVAASHQRRAGAPGAELLRVERLSVEARRWLVVRRASFSVRSGEVLGVAGLQGSGAGELLHALFGDGRVVEGSIHLHDRPVTLSSPRAAMRHGLALLTDDRKSSGLCQGLSIRANATLPSVESLSPGGWMRTRAERALARRAIDAFGIRCRGQQQTVATLSGGNQQKVALGKWLLREPSVFVLHDPTRGVDIGARQEIYRLIDLATARGAAVIVASTDLPELLALADRIIVLHRGEITGSFERSHATPEAIIAAAMGAQQHRGGRDA